MDAEELLVHDGGERQVAERIHAGIVDDLAVLVLACGDTKEERQPTSIDLRSVWGVRDRASNVHSSLKVK